ncbi:serine hydrolase [Pseudonocardia sp. S2-4]|uniref:Serine hydrolase n=2 Tax=Pseudonocardia humida TaxID=2800819 RepID=A0ABT1A1U5_9PSEU|nr:serine hydrolase [Pseudonocardia humida]
MPAYLAAQVVDRSHRAVVGPLRAGRGASGVVVHRGRVLAEWGDPTTVEMAFSVTKTFLSLVAGVAFDDGLLRLDDAVRDAVALPEFRVPPAHAITWRHLLQQTSGWRGTVWGKPDTADAQSVGEPGPPGTSWAYNDVRVNLLALALTALLGRELPDVLRERVTDPIGATRSWSWHGYAGSRLGDLRVVSGGAHWGGGLWISAADLALVGELVRRRGSWDGRRVLSARWLDESWAPCPVRPDYGLLWWLNDGGRVLPAAPSTGRAARGNRGRHLLWVDPARELVVASHWGDDVADLLAAVSAAIPRGATEIAG